MSEKTLDKKIINALKTVFDPEIPVDIYELGFIYKCEVTKDNDVLINMTLTSPNCTVAEELPQSVKETVQAVEGVNNVNVDKDKQDAVIEFLDSLEDDDDVQNVFSNANFRNN